MAVAARLDKSQFSAGELDPALHARIDLARSQAGLKACENYVVMVEGGVTRTPGTRYVGPLASEGQKGRLIPFEFSIDDSYMLAFNGGKMRVYWNGGVIETTPGSGVPYELATPFAEEVLDKLRTAGSADVVFIAWGGKPKVLTRIGHNNWTITDYVSLRGPIEPQNTDPARTITASAQIGSMILTASVGLFKPEHVGSTWRLDESNLANIPAWKGNETSLGAGHLRRNAGIVYSVASGTDAGPTSPTHDEGVVLSGQGNVAWQYEHSGYGYVRITGFISPTTVNAEVIGKLPHDVVAPNATHRWYEAAWSDALGWPDQVRLNDNRLLWSRGDKLWGTKINDYYDFTITAEDDSAIAARVTSQDGRLVQIMWMLNAGVVVLGTRSGEWMVRGGSDPFEAITLANIRAIPDSTEGSSAHVPQSVDGGAVFIGRNRRRLHFAKFGRLAEEVATDELTLYARNLLREGATALAYTRDPNRLVWIRQQNGELVAVTFRPDQDVVGWSRHPDPYGVVEDIAAVSAADATYSELWLIVRREINGVMRRYVEVMQPFFQPLDLQRPTAEGAWFVRCGLRLQSPSPVSTIANLDHLEGCEVAILADGIEHQRLTVDGGEITLARPSRDVLVGLPIKGRVRTLPMDTAIEGSTTKGRKKKADSVLLERLYGTGGTIAIAEGFQEPLLLSGQRVLDQPQPLFTDRKSVTVEGSIGETIEVELVSDDVYPMTILGLSPHLQFLEDG